MLDASCSYTPSCGLEARGTRGTYPAVKRPIILVPAIVAWQIGMTSWSSASNTLRRKGSAACASVSLLEKSEIDVPVEILRGTDGDEGVGVCESSEDADSVRFFVSMVS